ncbi:MAG: sugar transferase [Magnetococcus sp. DMHC-6]
MRTKRIFDFFFALVAILILAPFLILFAIIIKLDSPGPVFFVQERVGRYGKIFKILKFRTMFVHSEKEGSQVTVSKDTRVTSSGKILRRFKIDELPQIFNVLYGDMSFVGPRPEVPKFVAFYPEKTKEIVLSVSPGITDYAAIEFRNENELLVNQKDPELYYVHEILPIKLKYYEKYVQERSLWVDIRIIIKTCILIF